MPACAQPVEVLEHVPVPAAHTGVLRHIDDSQASVRGLDVAPIEPVSPLGPEMLLRTQLALAHRRAPGGRLDVGEPRIRRVTDLPTGLPGPQAVVNVLERHREVGVELPQLVNQLTAQVHRRTGHCERRIGHGGRPIVGTLEAVTVVEPLRSAAVAVGARRLDASVGVQEHRAGDADVVPGVSGVLECLQPGAVAKHVVVENDDVVLAAREAQPAVDAGRVALVGAAEHDLCALDLLEPRLMWRLASVVDHDDPRPPAVDGPLETPNRVDRRRRVSIGRHDDRDGATLAAIPPTCVAPLRPGLHLCPRSTLFPKQPQRRSHEPRQQLAPAVVPDGQIGATREVVEERSLAPPPGQLGTFAHTVRRSSEQARATRAGRRSACDPSVAPSARMVWWRSDPAAV